VLWRSRKCSLLRLLVLSAEASLVMKVDRIRRVRVGVRRYQESVSSLDAQSVS
jgi:hypothetical protein